MSTPAELASALRVLADQVGTLPDELKLCLSLSIQPWLGSVEVVDQVAAALGLTATPRQMGSGTWHHATPVTVPSIGLDVRVFTSCEAPGGAS